MLYLKTQSVKRALCLLLCSEVAVAFVLPVPSFAQSAAVPDAIDLAVIVQPILAVAGTVIASLLALYVPRLMEALEARTHIQLTDQQRATVLGAVRTAAGLIETRLDQGILPMARIEISNPTVRAEAAAAIAAVPIAAAALSMTVDGVARMIVGAVDTGAHGAAAA